MSDSNKEQRFIKIYASYIDEIYRYVFLRSGLQSAAAEDITQEIFLDVYKGFDKFKGLCSERTWVHRIAQNKVYDYYRKQYNRSIKSISIEAEDTAGFHDPVQDIDTFIENSDRSRLVSDCLNHLPQHYRITLLLKYIDKKSVKEIAFILDKSNKAIDNILQRAKLMFIKEYRSLNENNSL